MSDQLALVGPATPPDLRLGKQQRFALELIAEEPISSEDLGRAIHVRRHADPKTAGGHPADRTCQFCKPEGASMGSRLRELGLVRYTRAQGVWYLVEQGRPEAPVSSSGYDPQTAEIPY